MGQGITTADNQCRCVVLRCVECDTIGGYNRLLLLIFRFIEHGNEIYDSTGGGTIRPSETNQKRERLTFGIVRMMNQQYVIFHHQQQQRNARNNVTCRGRILIAPSDGVFYSSSFDYSSSDN